MKRELSAEIAAAAEDYVANLNKTLGMLRQECTEEEFKRYADGIAQVLEHLRDDILKPIYDQYSDLRGERS